jgi:hypothetical protein
LTEAGRLRADLLISSNLRTSAHIVEVFRTEEAAREYIAERTEEGHPEFRDDNPRIEFHRGASLLDLISYADILDIYNGSEFESFVMTHRGGVVMEETYIHEPPVEELIAALCNRSGA